MSAAVATDDVTGRLRQPAAAATDASAEFTTYDVTDIQLYTGDAQRIDTTQMMVKLCIPSAYIVRPSA